MWITLVTRKSASPIGDHRWHVLQKHVSNDHHRLRVLPKHVCNDPNRWRVLPKRVSNDCSSVTHFAKTHLQWWIRKTKKKKNGTGKETGNRPYILKSHLTIQLTVTSSSFNHSSSCYIEKSWYIIQVPHERLLNRPWGGCSWPLHPKEDKNHSWECTLKSQYHTISAHTYITVLPLICCLIFSGS